MKASPSQIFKEAETLKASLTGEGLSSSEVWLRRQELGRVLESLLLTDLDFALDKKVEQDLWSFVFRNPIAACQSKAKEHKKVNHGYTNSQLPILLETASGFYLQLLQKLCCEYDIDLPCHPRDSVYGLTKEWISKYPIVHQPRKSSLLYICQHCLVHLGDIARYRGQSLQAETFYRHAVELVPSNGQPYNQLALLEAASGEKLSTVYFYVRSLCVQHPFPLAATNLQNLFLKMSSDGSGPEGKTRMSAFEYVSVFLQFHSIIHLNNLHKTDGFLSKLGPSLPALIIAEKLEQWQLVQMVAVCLFAVEHAWGTMDLDKETAFDHSMLGQDEIRAASLVEELLASMLHAFLLPVHASLDPKETAGYYTLPAIKVILDWLLQDPQLLQHEAIHKNPQVWHGLCKLLNDLDVVTKEPFDLKKLEDIPLPEDWDLQSFLPLKKSQRRLKFSLKNAAPSDEECTWLRSVRLCKLGESLAGVNMEGVHLLSVSEGPAGKRVFKAIHQVESLSEDVLQQIQELTTHPSPSSGSSTSETLTNGAASVAEVPSSTSSVRFKLDDTQQRRDEAEKVERREARIKEAASVAGREQRRTGRQNVAMQAILQQQRAAQISGQHGRGQEIGMENNKALLQESASRQNSRPLNHLDNSHHLRTNTENCLTPQNVKEVNMNRTAHHISPEQYNQFQQQAHAVNGVQQCERNEAWIQQFNMHQAGVPSVNQVQRENFAQPPPRSVVRPPTFPYQPPPPQQPPTQVLAANPQAFITSPAAPNLLWNYMGFVPAPYQQQQQQILVQQQQQSAGQVPAQALARGQQFYVVNGTPQQDNREQLGSMDLYRGAQQQQQQQSDVVLRDQMKEHLANQARMWQQERGDMISQVGRPVSQSGQQIQGLPQSHHDNTYSLFNSPWPPPTITLPRPPAANKENQHNNIDPVFMQSRIQSLWSGPGPSPLERLLEQQKQRRDGSTQ